MKINYRREQHYAVSENGTLIHIEDAHRGVVVCYCPHCGCKMMKKCGTKRAWHFAHDWHDANDLQRNCSYETYLHGYAKLRLKQWFDESDSIKLLYMQTTLCKSYDFCKLIYRDSCSKLNYKTKDLKEYFNNCSVESFVKGSNGNYRADLLLTSDNDTNRKLLIEIKVKHECSEKKKQSNIPIIEFDIESEEDIDSIIKHDDIKESEKVRFYGFKNSIKKDNKKNITSVRQFTKFFLYNSGNVRCRRVDCQFVSKHHRNSLLEITADIAEEDIWKLYRYGLMIAQEKGFKFKNCFLCENYNYNKERDCKFCKIKNEEIKRSADAIKCESFVFKANVFSYIARLSSEVGSKIIDTYINCKL